MGKKKISVICLMLLLLCVTAVPIQAKAGWKTINADGDKQYIDETGNIVKNKWIGKRHVNKNGFMDRNKFLTKKINGKKKKVFVANDGKYITNFKGGWVKISKKYYYYTKKGKMYRNKWFKVNGKRYYVNEFGVRATGLTEIKGALYYFNSSGVNETGWKTIKKKKYYFMSTDRKAIVNRIYKFKSNKKSYGFNSEGQMVTGWYEFDDHMYYFKDNMKTGWLTLDGKTYYLVKSTKNKGQRAEGIFSIGGKLYYFDPVTGEQLKNQTVIHNDRKYIIDKSGVCTLVPDAATPTGDMLFFLKFESGSEAYNQTGGDNGCACGAYQFDYRYALHPFVKYAYAQSPSVCAEFKTYAAYKAEESVKLKSNSKFYKAWKAIYKRNPKTFAALQDAYAKINYYDNVERKLFESGIDLSSRPDVVKGAVFSYSIQHGQSSAVDAVKAIKATNTMENATFLKKLYNYRIKKFPAYKTRYDAEYALALTKLK